MIPLQLHCGDLNLDNIQVRNYREEYGLHIRIPEGVYAPLPKGGFWTSTFTPNEKYCSKWVNFWVSEYTVSLGRCYVLRTKEDAKVYIIDKYSDLVSLCEKFGCNISMYTVEKNSFVPNWENVSKEYDGVMLTEIGQKETIEPFVNKYTLYGWDVESALWFRNVFEDVIPLEEYEDRTCRVTKEEDGEPSETSLSLAPIVLGAGLLLLFSRRLI